MIKYTITNKMLKQMAFEVARRSSRIFALPMFLYGFLGFLLISYDTGKPIYLIGLALLAGLLLAALPSVLIYLVILKRSKEASKTIANQQTVWQLHSETIEIAQGEVSSKFPYNLIKKNWQTKNYLYLKLKGSAVIGCPKDSIDEKDRGMLTKKLGVKIK